MNAGPRLQACGLRKSAIYIESNTQPQSRIRGATSVPRHERVADAASIEPGRRARDASARTRRTASSNSASRNALADAASTTRPAPMEPPTRTNRATVDAPGTSRCSHRSTAHAAMPMTSAAPEDLREGHRHPPAVQATQAAAQEPEERARVEDGGHRGAEREAPISEDAHQCQVHHDVDRHGCRADEDRRAAVVNRVEARDGDLHRGVADQPGRVEHQRGRRGGRVRRRERSRARTAATRSGARGP